MMYIVGMVKCHPTVVVQTDLVLIQFLFDRSIEYSILENFQQIQFFYYFVQFQTGQTFKPNAIQSSLTLQLVVHPVSHAEVAPLILRWSGQEIGVEWVTPVPYFFLLMDILF